MRAGAGPGLRGAGGPGAGWVCGLGAEGGARGSSWRRLDVVVWERRGVCYLVEVRLWQWGVALLSLSWFVGKGSGVVVRGRGCQSPAGAKWGAVDEQSNLARLCCTMDVLM